MGKSKIKIQKIEKESNRRVTFNKRRIGLLKKAYEISVLCGVDIALIFFSQNGEMTCFHGWSSIEEVVMKFANTSEHERAKCHVQKYTTIEDQLGNTMPRNIENEEMFQEVARKLYQSHPGLASLSESDRLDLLTIQEIKKEITDVQRFLSLYDLNMPIEALISSSEDAAQMEFYVQRQLENLQNFKQLAPIVSPQLPATWLDSQNDNRTYGENHNFEPNTLKQECDDDVQMGHMMFNSLRTHGAESTYMSQELGPTSVDNNTHTISGWDAFSSDMGLLYSGVSSDQIHAAILPELSESGSDLLPSSIEGDINAHDFLEDISTHDLQSKEKNDL